MANETASLPFKAMYKRELLDVDSALAVFRFRPAHLLRAIARWLDAFRIGLSPGTSK